MDRAARGAVRNGFFSMAKKTGFARFTRSIPKMDRLVARWQEDYPRRYCDSDYGHFLWLNDNLFFVAPDQFTKLNFEDIAAKKKRMEMIRPNLRTYENKTFPPPRARFECRFFRLFDKCPEPARQPAAPLPQFAI